MTSDLGRPRRHLRSAAVCALLLALAAAAFPGCCGFGPCAPAGLEKIDVDWDLQVNDIVVPPGGKYLVLNTAGPRPRAICYDRDLDRLGAVRGAPNLAASIAPDEVLNWGVQGLTLGDLPEFEATERCDSPDEVYFYRPRLVQVALSDEPAAWVGVWQGHASRVRSGPLRIEQTLRIRTQTVYGAAFDQTTGSLLVVGDETRLERLDVGTLRSTYVVELPTEKVGFYIAAAGGTAWITTRDDSGRVIEVDLASQSATKAYETVSGRGQSLGLSNDGSLLAVAAFQFVDRSRTDTRLILYDVTPDGLVERRRLDVAMPGVPNDIAVIPEWEMVVVASNPAAYAWRYAEPP